MKILLNDLAYKNWLLQKNLNGYIYTFCRSCGRQTFDRYCRQCAILPTKTEKGTHRIDIYEDLSILDFVQGNTIAERVNRFLVYAQFEKWTYKDLMISGPRKKIRYFTSEHKAPPGHRKVRLWVPEWVDSEHVMGYYENGEEKYGYEN